MQWQCMVLMDHELSLYYYSESDFHFIDNGLSFHQKDISAQYKAQHRVACRLWKVIHHGCMLVTQWAFPYGVSSELIDGSSGRTETKSHTTEWDSKATPLRLTSHAYLLVGEQGLHIKSLFVLQYPGLKPGLSWLWAECANHYTMQCKPDPVYWW